MKQERTDYLVQQYMAGLLTEAEREELHLLLHDPEQAGLLISLVGNIEAAAKAPVYLDDRENLILFNRMMQASRERAATAPVNKIAPVTAPSFLYRYRLAVAAVFLMMLGATWFLLFRTQNKHPVAVAPEQQREALPGHSGAVLTLADGSTIVLDSVADGKLAEQGNSHVVKLNDKLTYENGITTGDVPVAYNTIATPRARQFQLTLPDGTQVWLNAMSSLRFPTAFKGTKREVEVSGEAYFDVARKPGQPFTVKIKGKTTDIEVLGTQFNVMAYADEATLQTTLVEGAVNVHKDAKTVLLKPGQQSEILVDGRMQLHEADLAQVTAWKNGLQSFSGADLQTIMRQVGRWYDFDVVYKGQMPVRTFSGEIPRSANLSELLQLFKASKINFEINYELKRITVIP
jgi:ferric-dicitrate binding protein FerR (iron transport regulator)